MLNRFRGWFQGSTPEAPKPAAPRGALLTPTPPPPEGFEAAWATLGRIEAGDTPPLPLPSPAHLEQVAALRALVLGQFQAHLPEPAAFPSVAVEVLDLLEQPDPELSQLLLLLGRDPAITARVLRVANSAFYARGREAQDLRAAILRLGIRTAGEIAVAVASHSLFDLELRAEQEMFMVRLMDLYHDALATGFGASTVAFRARAGEPNQAFLGGLFHEIGHSLAIRALAALMVQGRLAPDQPREVLDEVLLAVHLELGAAAVQLWGLPAYLQPICARHHEPDLPPGPTFGNTHAVRVAAGLLRLVRDPQDLRHGLETAQSLRTLGLPRAQVAELYGLMIGCHERAVGMLPA
jgi:HD-like signal output (HDOD) protein